jgi:drug/metabolite transporter (DMT)-like permease
MNMPYIGEITAIVTVALWSFTALFFSEAARRAGSVQVNITRLLLAFLFLSFTILVMGLKVDLSGSQLWYLVLSGFIGLVFGDTFLFKSYQYIGARFSMLVMALAPAIAAVMSYFMLGETLSGFGILGIFITIAGISIVVLENREKPAAKYKVSPIGIFFAFLGAVGQGAGLVLAKLAFQQGEINGFVATFIRIAAAAVVMLPLGLITGKYKNPVAVFKKDCKAFAYTFGGSVLGPYLGITFSLISVANTSVGISSTIMATVPIVMLPLQYFMFKEKVSWRAVIGAIVSVSGVVMLFIR